MADQLSKDAAAKERIIKHLNADHQRSLSYYLQHYNSLSSWEASKPVLTDITFDVLTFRLSSGNTSTIPLYPPLTSWSDARVRTVEMDRISREALDISSIRITEYEPPKSVFHITMFALCLFTFVIFTTRQWIVDGTWFYDTALPWFPGGPKWFLGISKAIALPVLGIHLVEAYMLDRTRLRKYGVERGSGLWWKWIFSSFIEGFPSFHRIDATVKRKEREVEKAKH
jgi:hypothetical protein